MDLRKAAIWISNYKCFGDDSGVIEGIYPINVIIGRNNSGKSALLEMLEFSAAPDKGHVTGAGKGVANLPYVTFETNLLEEDLERVFDKRTSGGDIGGNHWEYGRRWIGKRVQWDLNADGSQSFRSVEPASKAKGYQTLIRGDIVVRNKSNPLLGRQFVRLNADRDIVSEDESAPELSPNGRGATKLVENFVNRADRPSDAVERKLLAALNKIFRPDAQFSDIVVQRVEDKWEIYLEEESKGRVALSSSGSGLKSIILVLCNTILLPLLKGISLDKFVFAFEELENNLHPSLLRRLLSYLRELALTENCLIFLTTHSSTVINLFGADSEAKIMHVVHDGKNATISPVVTYFQRRDILDDLDIRASDLLQSNGVIWVEGPSDRIYVNRWIELWSEGRLLEGTHYQCVFYGGRLLAHLRANPSDTELDQLVQILVVNRNAAVLMDSDRKSSRHELADTKLRIEREIQSVNGFSWITAGREIENYVPPEAVQVKLGLDSRPEPIPRFQDFASYLDKYRKGDGERFKRTKALFAETIAPLLTKEDLEVRHDLDEKMNALCARIRTWNGE